MAKINILDEEELKEIIKKTVEMIKDYAVKNTPEDSSVDREQLETIVFNHALLSFFELFAMTNATAYSINALNNDAELVNEIGDRLRGKTHAVSVRLDDVIRDMRDSLKIAERLWRRKYGSAFTPNQTIHSLIAMFYNVIAIFADKFGMLLLNTEKKIAEQQEQQQKEKKNGIIV